MIGEHEWWIRLVTFTGILLFMALWEIAFPRRPLTVSKWARWASNLGLVLVDSLAVRLVFPAALVGFALLVEQRGWGILHALGWPSLPSVLLSILVLDFTIYLQHVMFHAIPLLWRLHMVHHTDLDFDVTTGVRFHPIEILLSMGIKIAVVFLIGAPPLAVLLFEILLNGTSMFNHGNVRYPKTVDTILRLMVVTPEMHRVHHSNIRWETNSNFGFNFPWWDRLFGTYRDQPAKGHLEMNIGLIHYQDPHRLTFPWLVLLPLIGKLGIYPITRRTGEK